MGAYKYSVRTGTKATSERSALQALGKTRVLDAVVGV